MEDVNTKRAARVYARTQYAHGQTIVGGGPTAVRLHRQSLPDARQRATSEDRSASAGLITGSMLRHARIGVA